LQNRLWRVALWAWVGGKAGFATHPPKLRAQNPFAAARRKEKCAIRKRFLQTFPWAAWQTCCAVSRFGHGGVGGLCKPFPDTQANLNGAPTLAQAVVGKIRPKSTLEKPRGLCKSRSAWHSSIARANGVLDTRNTAAWSQCAWRQTPHLQTDKNHHGKASPKPNARN
jgi:hypothetical protein